jgi:Flp pilus assembly protein TadG
MSWKAFWTALGRDTRGAAAVEFALWSVFVFIVLFVSIDFGFYLAHTGRIASASEQTAIVAYNRREAGPVNTASLADFLNASARTPGSAVRTTVTCNGAAAACDAVPSARQCVCVSRLTPTYTASARCGDPCASGATSGFYVALSSEYDFQPIIPSHPFLNGKVIRQSVTVRLQ